MKRRKSKKVVSITSARMAVGQPARRSEKMEAARIEYMWRDPAGVVQRKSKEWRHPKTTAAIHGWLQDYMDMVDDGYRPQGFDYTPIPICARITLRGLVVAEWQHSSVKERIG